MPYRARRVFGPASYSAESDGPDSEEPRIEKPGDDDTRAGTADLRRRACNKVAWFAYGRLARGPEDRFVFEATSARIPAPIQATP